MSEMGRTPSPVVVLWLCEAARVHLRPDTLYRFEVDPDCRACKIEADHAAWPSESAPARVTSAEPI